MALERQRNGKERGERCGKKSNQMSPMRKQHCRLFLHFASLPLLPAWQTHLSLPSDEGEIKVHKREWEWNQECAGDESPTEQAAIMTDDDASKRGTLGQRYQLRTRGEKTQKYQKMKLGGSLIQPTANIKTLHCATDEKWQQQPSPSWLSTWHCIPLSTACAICQWVTMQLQRWL